MCSPCESGLSEQATLYVCRPAAGLPHISTLAGFWLSGSRFASAAWLVWRFGVGAVLFLIYAGCGSSFGRSRFFVARRLARG